MQTISTIPRCLFTYLRVCFITPPSQSFSPFFGFATFITALTLIAVVFTISDTRYRFRIAVAPLPLVPISFWSSAFLGLTILLSDVWFSERWPLPRYFQDQAAWQAILGAAFLLLVLIWLYFAFLNPATFGRMNAYRFVSASYYFILRGDDAELATIAAELGRSGKKIVDLWSPPENTAKAKPPDVAVHAHNLLLLMGNRKLCKHIVTNAPGTAIAIFRRISEKKRYGLPVRQFAVNTVTEAIQNTDSILYHEDEGYESGLLGYLKPFSAAICGDYRLVEGLGHNFGSPLDVGYKAVRSWNAAQLGAYCRLVLITLNNYLTSDAVRTHSFSLARAFENIQNAFADTYKLNDPQTPYYPSDIFDRLVTAVDFVKDAVTEIGKLDPVPRPLRLRPRTENPFRTHDIYDEVAELMFQLVLAASYVTSDPDRSWTVQHNTVWTNFFGLTNRDKAWPLVQFKLRRLIFDDITRLPFLNYQSARVLGMTLNVLGFKEWQGQNHAERLLQKATLGWTKANFLRLWEANPDVAISGLPAALAFDAENKRFVKTYAKGLQREAPRAYFEVGG